jgi:hypothetical protein
LFPTNKCKKLKMYRFLKKLAFAEFRLSEVINLGGEYSEL